MFGSKQRIEQAESVAQTALVLAQATAAAQLAGSRSSRVPDLSKPITIAPESVEAFKNRSIKRGLQKLFHNHHFSICDFDNLIKLSGLYVDGKLYRSLSTFHCVEWGDMDAETREQVQAQILAVFIVDEPEEGANA